MTARQRFRSVPFLAFFSFSPFVTASAQSIAVYDSAEAFQSHTSTSTDSAGWTVLTATFPSQVKTLFPANDTVWVHLRVPEGEGTFPCVLILPILGEPAPVVESWFYEPLLRRGIAVMLVELPQQFHRRPSGANSGAAFLGRSPETVRRGFAQAVLDVRRAATWVSRRPEIDGRRLALLGISLGALVGSAAYAVDGRFDDAVFMLGGAGFADLLSASELTGPILARIGIPRERLGVLADVDPLYYKEANVERPALLVNAAWDAVVPVANGRLLQEAYPVARQIWIPAGHYSAVVHVPWVARLAARRLAGSLHAGEVVPFK